MKFLCPSCKAKYQIADEKVIGRSVKMKCRQCGHIIEIQESVVEASAGVSQPPIALNSVPAPALAPPPKPAKPPTERLGARPRTDTHGDKPALAPARGGAELPLHSAKLPAALAQPPNRNFRAPAPRVVAPVAASPAAPPRPGSSISSQSLPKVAPRSESAVAPTNEHKAPRPGVASARDDAAGPSSERVSPQSAGAGPSSQRPAPAVVRSNIEAPTAASAAALRHLVGSKSAQSGPALHPSPTVTAPAQTGSLAGGHATRATLEPAIAAGVLGVATVRRSGEALAEAFTSSVGVVPAASDQLVGDEWYVGVNDNPIGPIPLSELRARAAQGQVTVDSLVWRDGFEDWKPVGSFPELLAVVEEAISSVNASRGPIIAARAPVVDFGPAISLSPLTERNVAVAAVTATKGAAIVASPESSQMVPVVSPALSAEELAAVRGHGHGGIPKGVWVVAGATLALGLAMGFVLFGQKPPEIKYVEVARSASAAVVAAPAPSVETQEAPIIASAESIRAVAKRASTDTKANTDTNSVPPATSSGLKGLSGLRALGPQSGPSETGSSSGASAAQALDSATLQKTVSRYTASVKRSCWQPSLDSRAPDAPTTARVSVKIDISPSGNVSSVSSNGDPKGYRGLATCIESRVRSWSFPPSSGATTVNVPFVFAAQ